FHAFLGEKMPDWKAAASLVRKIAENYKLPYYTLSPTYSVCKNHGYLAGEHFDCPQCGESAEVYSRITGYYRPVQNWNDGKIQEYKDRKTYNIADSKLNSKRQSVLHGKNASDDDLCINGCHDKVMLFATHTCPNCKVAVSLLEKNNIGYEMIYADENENLARQFNIMQAPTLVVIKDGNVDFRAGMPGIVKYVEGVK
ncbi:MAG TPA: ribonucleoside triphosphate reductase, partial [Clostridiales bacterium]|nr:ribonucleoside triphosphate reductase [Clostridiales bacterium]